MRASRAASLVLSLGVLASASAAPSSPPRRSPKPRPAPQGPASVVEESVTVPLLEKVRVYRPRTLDDARGLVLFLSGDGGWNLGVVDMARRIAPRAVVVGLSFPAYRRLAEREPRSCWYPAGELESMAQVAEKALGLPRYVRPILVGYSSGATLVYGALAQAPDDTFGGALSLGFCPDLEVARPLCGREGWKPSFDAKKRKSLLPPRRDLAEGPAGRPRWFALQGNMDQVCAPAQTARFAGEIPGAKVVSLPRVGHGFSVVRNWGAAFDEALNVLLGDKGAWDVETEPPIGVDSTSELETDLRERLEALGLPLEILWPPNPRAALVFVSGDGGWAEIDREVASRLAVQGVAVVGWNALRYFWQEKTPGGFRADLVRLLEALPDGIPVFLGGYSFGAEVSVVALTGSGTAGPPVLRRVLGLVLLAPGPYATFEVSPLDWILNRRKPTDYPVREAIARADLGTLCLKPAADSETGCPETSAARIRTVVIPGGHHFGGDFDGLADRILAFMGARALSPPASRGPAGSRSGSAGSRGGVASSASGGGRASSAGGGSRARP